MLSTITAEALVRSWPCKPKLHYTVAHLPRQAALINPRLVQAYASESMVGRMAKVYKLSVDGPSRRVVQQKFMKKYRTGMLLVWKDVV